MVGRGAHHRYVGATARSLRVQVWCARSGTPGRIERAPSRLVRPRRADDHPQRNTRRSSEVRRLPRIGTICGIASPCDLALRLGRSSRWDRLPGVCATPCRSLAGRKHSVRHPATLRRVPLQAGCAAWLRTSDLARLSCCRYHRSNASGRVRVHGRRAKSCVRSS